jgi:cell division septum initiation protein DivIVA
VPVAEIERLERENAELRRRVAEAEQAIAELRESSAARRAEVRSLAEQLPAAVSRRVILRSMVADVVRHPDKVGAVQRALHKLGRAPRKAARVALRLLRRRS